MSSNKFLYPIETIQEAHQRALDWVSDAYLFYLVSMHRRPVYRHQYGDISLNQPSVQGFIDSYLADKGWNTERRCCRYMRILDLFAYMQRDNSDFIDWGTVPVLKPRGIQWLNACFCQLGEMVNEYGGWESYVSKTKEQAR